MYLIRYVVCMCLVLQMQHMYAQDQSGQTGSDTASGEAVHPLVDPIADQSPAPAEPASTESAALPWTPSETSQVPTTQEVQAPAAAPAAVPTVAPSVQAPVQATAEPVKPATAPSPAAPVEDKDEVLELKGIDTVDLKDPEGNWLFKRIWWEKSKEIYGKIRDRVDKIVESRMHFFKERVKLARDVIDPFYMEMGLDQGALRASVDHLLQLLKSEENQNGKLSPQAQEKFDALQEEKAAITQLGESVTNVAQMDQKLDDALEKLMEQINLARSYERDAWQKLEKIAEELSDKNAREDYYAIATIWRNVKEIANYIQGPFAEHFIKLAQTSVQNVKNIKTIADALQQKGFALKERIELSVEKEQQVPEEEEEEELPVRTQGWGEWLLEMIAAPFNWLADLFGM